MVRVLRKHQKTHIQYGDTPIRGTLHKVDENQYTWVVWVEGLSVPDWLDDDTFDPLGIDGMASTQEQAQAEMYKACAKILPRYQKISLQAAAKEIKNLTRQVEKIRQEMKDIAQMKGTPTARGVLAHHDVAMLKKGAVVSLTPRQLELYSREPGALEAAAEISRALTKAVVEVKALCRKKPSWDERWLQKMLWMVYKKHVWPILVKHQALGATDTEPDSIAKGVLVRVVKDIYGDYGWLDF